MEIRRSIVQGLITSSLVGFLATVVWGMVGVPDSPFTIIFQVLAINFFAMLASVFIVPGKK
jgi:hypothetical protein